MYNGYVIIMPYNKNNTLHTHEIPTKVGNKIITTFIFNLRRTIHVIVSCPYMASYMMASYRHAHVRF
jgi:hypothetical protein